MQQPVSTSTYCSLPKLWRWCFCSIFCLNLFRTLRNRSCCNLQRNGALDRTLKQVCGACERRANRGGMSMCKWCKIDSTLIPMESGVKMPMICKTCGTYVEDWDWKRMREELDKTCKGYASCRATNYGTVGKIRLGIAANDFRDL